MLMDEYDEGWRYPVDPEPESDDKPWWIAWGDVIAFGVLCVSGLTVALSWLWSF